MSRTIEEILNGILKAVYGREVRQDIHDGIEMGYTIATESKTAAEQAVKAANAAISEATDAAESANTAAESANGAASAANDAADRADAAAGGDIEAKTVTYTTPDTYTAPESGQTMGTLMGRITKGLSDLFASLAQKLDVSKVIASTNITQAGYVMDGKTCADALTQLNSNMPANKGLYLREIVTGTNTKIQITVPKTAYNDYSCVILGRLGTWAANAEFIIRCGGAGTITNASCDDDNISVSFSENVVTLTTGTNATLLFVYYSVKHLLLEFELLP